MIYDVLDGERVTYQKGEETIVAKAEAYGNPSTFSISAEEQEMGTELRGLVQTGKRVSHNRRGGSYGIWKTSF